MLSKISLIFYLLTLINIKNDTYFDGLKVKLMRNQDGFNGERLKQARIYREMTVAELAEKIGCKRQTVSMYENSKSHPMDETIIQKLSNTLNFPTKFFTENSSDILTGSTYFRALLTTNKKYRNEQILKMQFLAQIYFFINEYIEFPRFSLPLDLFSDIPEVAATQLRKKWGLGEKPIENINFVVEQHGILVTKFETATNDIDAFSQMVKIDENIIFLIAYSSNKTSAARIHFDIAHELGHICMHEWSEDIETLTRGEFKDRENQANRFAASFLLPEQAFRRDVIQNPLSIPYYKQLKGKWKVSIAAMIRRAYSLNVISMEDYQALMRILQRRGMRKEEPLDDKLLTADPSLLKTAVIMLLNENVFTAKQFVDELSFSHNLSLNPEEIEYLLDLPKGTLSKGTVIEFPNLRIKSDDQKG